MQTSYILYVLKWNLSTLNVPNLKKRLLQKQSTTALGVQIILIICKLRFARHGYQPKGDEASKASHVILQKRLLIYRIIALFIILLIFYVLLETSLRLANYGYFAKSTIHDVICTRLYRDKS